MTRSHIERLAARNPTYIDIEEGMTPPQSTAKLIVSYHNFNQTPHDLEALLQRLKQTPADFYKIACHAQTTNDSLRMALFAQKHPNLIGLCMGPHAILSRLLCHPWTYVRSRNQTAPGQLSIEEHKRYNPSGPLYGLIGAPVTKSISHLTHNKRVRYVKMHVEPKELTTFFDLAKQLDFRGLSVTMPLKEHVIPFLDTIDPDAQTIGAVNTITIRNGQLIGHNTDGIGALDAIGPVQDKTVCILGAGGAARALIFEAKKRGATVHIVNRTQEKGEALAHCFGVHSGLPEHYDILINTTPNPDPDIPLLPTATVMDINITPTRLQAKAAHLGCSLVHGYQMFFNQARAQFALWSASTHLKPTPSQ